MSTDYMSSLLPKSWYNIVPELGFSIPMPLHPVEDRLARVEEFNWLWSTEALRIEFLQGEYATNPWIDIPQPILEAYSQYRPTQLYRARALEKHLGTKAEIYLKREDQNPAGSHKMNTALPQAFTPKMTPTSARWSRIRGRANGVRLFRWHPIVSGWRQKSS